MDARLSTRLLLAVLVAAFALIALRGIAAPFTEGHNGYNGAAFSQAARNSLRFGIVPQVQYHTGLEAPETHLYYTHHPMMLHAHLAAVFSIFGERTAAGRAVPAFYSIATLLLLFALVRRTNDARTAVLAVGIYVVTPINLIFANMIDHEQGCLFYCLAMLLFYMRWLDHRRWYDVVGLLVATTIAAHWDWPAYYLAFFIFLHAARLEVRGAAGGFRLRSTHLWLALFCVVVLVNFFGFFHWVDSQVGDLGDMGNAFDSRFGFHLEYLTTLFIREIYLHGPLLLLLLAGIIVELVAAARARRFTRGHLVALCFLGMQVIHSGAFGHANYIHAYWVFYASPAFAVGGALALTSAHRFLLERARRRLSPRRADTLLTLTLVAPLACAQAVFALYAYHDKYETGGGEYDPDFGHIDNLEEVRWAEYLQERFPRGTTEFVLHPSMARTRIDFHFHLDAPYTEDFVLLRSESGIDRVLLMDLGNDKAPLATLAQFRVLLQTHSASVVDERFVAVEAGGQRGQVTHVKTEPRSASSVARWLQSPYHPLVTYRQSSEPPAFARRVRESTPYILTHMIGGGGGSPNHFQCSDGSPLTGLDVVAERRSSGVQVVVDIRGRCADGPGIWFTAYGLGWDAESFSTLVCLEGQDIVGFGGRRGVFVDAMELICRARGAAPFPEERSARLGGEGGQDYAMRCPYPSVASGIRGRSGALIDAIGLYCTSLEMVEDEP